MAHALQFQYPLINIQIRECMAPKGSYSAFALCILQLHLLSVRLEMLNPGQIAITSDHDKERL
jgi:hypothetical protein